MILPILFDAAITIELTEEISSCYNNNAIGEQIESIHAYTINDI